MPYQSRVKTSQSLNKPLRQFMTESVLVYRFLDKAHKTQGSSHKGLLVGGSPSAGQLHNAPVNELREDCGAFLGLCGLDQLGELGAHGLTVGGLAADDGHQPAICCKSLRKQTNTACQFFGWRAGQLSDRIEIALKQLLRRCCEQLGKVWEVFVDQSDGQSGANADVLSIESFEAMLCNDIDS